MKKNLSLGVLALMLFLFPAIGRTANLLEITFPITKTYIEYVDYAPFDFSAFGDVTATLHKVANFGGNAGDFAGFVPGNIALIERGIYTFQAKVLNAQAALASGAIVYNNVAGLNYGTLSAPVTAIPSISVSNAVGLELSSYLLGGSAVTIHLHIDTAFSYPSAVPEPVTLLLLCSGLVGLIGIRSKVKK